MKKTAKNPLVTKKTWGEILRKVHREIAQKEIAHQLKRKKCHQLLKRLGTDA
jgi:hypothetical protein